MALGPPAPSVACAAHARHPEQRILAAAQRGWPSASVTRRRPEAARALSSNRSHLWAQRA
eukprot:2488502-Prymnesium_polylepis.1